jgi:hypothetical protein
MPNVFRERREREGTSSPPDANITKILQIPGDCYKVQQLSKPA